MILRSHSVVARQCSLIVLLGVLLTPTLFAGELRVERVFGPEIRTGPYKHPARIEALRNGDLYVVYYGGEGEYALDTGVFGSRLKKGSRKWTPPTRIASDPFRSLGNGVVWQSPDGLVWLFYVVRYGETWSTSRVQAKVSRDNARTWSDAFPLVSDEGMMVCNRPIVLSNGDYLLPLYYETGHDTESVGPESSGLFLRYDVKQKEWKQTGRIRSVTGNIQPAVVETRDNYLIAFCRRGGNYEPTTNGWLIRAESRDGGWTWSEGVNSSFKNPNASVDFIKLASGNLLLIFNDSMNERTPLTVALSADAGQSWPWQRNVATGDYDYAYPMAVQTSDGRIHLIFTSHERTTVNRAIFDEEWIRHGGLVRSWLTK
ncbi:MAG: exo-alpha-sialidase [Verrucomicrobiae bacterium]|nr:exo-alpha-sialidase [Verrucomicrobiae bacterium]